MRKQSGISLLELMIVVVIVGILASIAYPSYQESVRKTRRADCSGALVGLSNAMERFFTVNGTYERAAAAGADTGAPAIFPAACPAQGTATYALTITAGNPSNFAVQAAPVGVQASDKCGTMTLTNTGLKGVSGAHAGVTAEDCW